MSFFTGRGMGFFMLFFVSILLIGLASNICAEVINYEGINKCGAMQVKVSFAYDKTKSTVNNFTATHSCVKGIEGQGRISTEISVPLSVKDNKFRVSNIVEGTISSNGKASGKIIEAQGRSSQCPDGKMYSNCVDWEATSVK